MVKKNNNFAKAIASLRRYIPWKFQVFIMTQYAILTMHTLKVLTFKKNVLNIEISNCNLKCAMCPRGGVENLKNDRKGMMDFELYKKIIDKVVFEKIRFKELWFGNWGEPLLNPRFPEMVRYAKTKLSGTTILSFTNLTCMKDAAAIIDSGLDIIRISISGMTQEVYSKNHIGGDVDVVLSNLRELIRIKKERNSQIKMIMVFHEFIYNKKDAEQAKKFCSENDIEFDLHWCYLPCVESNIKYHQNKQESAKFYGRFIDCAREELLMHTLDDYRACTRLNYSVVIDFDGRLYRCCGVYEEKYLLGSFFDYKIRDIQGIKSKICEVCAKTPIIWR